MLTEKVTRAKASEMLGIPVTKLLCNKELRKFMREEKCGRSVRYSTKYVAMARVMMEEMITRSQAAAIVGCTVKQFISRTKLRRVLGEKKVFGRMYYSKKKIEAWQELYKNNLAQ